MHSVIPLSAMSESGDTPPYHRRRRRRRRRRYLVWLCFLLLVILFLAAAAVIIALTVLRPRDPIVELLSVNATGVAPRVVILPTVSIQLNVAFHLLVRVGNPNRAAFDHSEAPAQLLYRGASVGEAVIPAGTVPSRGAITVSLDMAVQADRVVAAPGLVGLLGDVLAGKMEFAARTNVPGRVRILGLVKRRAEANSVCHVVISFPDLNVRQQDCQNDIKL